MEQSQGPAPSKPRCLHWVDLVSSAGWLSSHCDAQVQARGPPSEDDPTIAGHLLRLRDQKGQPLSDDRLHAEFSAMFIGGMVCSGMISAWLGLIELAPTLSLS